MHRNLLDFLAAAYLVNFEYNSTTTTPGFVVVFFFSLKVWVAKMTITWTSIIKLNTSCRFHRQSKRSFHIGYSVVPMGHVRSPDYQKFLGSMDTNFFLPTVLYCEHRSSSTIRDSRFAYQMKPHLSYL